MRGNQSWVTYASDDQEGIKALILGRSLRRTLTRRALTIFISRDVSEEIWEHLEREFDRCVRFSRQQLDHFRGLPFSTLAKIQCWNLNKLDKFAFIDCNAMMLRNSDELFGQDGFINIKNFKGETVTSLIVDCPSTEKFTILHSASQESINLDRLIGTEMLNEKYSIPVDIKGSNFYRNIAETNIIYFNGPHPVDILPTLNGTKYGQMEHVILNFWLELLGSGIVNQSLFENISKTLKMEPETIRRIIQEPPKSFEHLEKLSNSIAIVGMSMRFPGSNTLDEFWDLLINGKDGIIKVPEGRWQDDQCFNRPENTMETQAGFLKCPVGEVDTKFFGLSPVEVSMMDPQQRITLQVMWEALEDAGINPIGLRNSNTGVFGGWWRTDYKDMLQESGVQEGEFFRGYMGNALGTLTGKISHVLELTGPSVSTESGCSTSIVAVDMACKSLQNEDCNLALAFGVNLLLSPFGENTLTNFVAPDGHCKTFDAKADGFGRAEGCAVLVLKRLPDAVKDGDRILGVVRGSAVVQEGPSKSQGTPTKQCEALAMQLALQDAGVKPKDVSFVETHGTGTPVGDPMEVAAIAKAYSKDRVDKLIIGSVKTNIGHTESCSGIAGIIKTLLSLKHEVIPPHRNFDTLNPEINLDSIPAEIPLTSVKWPKNTNGQPRIAGVSSFGITGTDAHVIIQETPDIPKPALSIESRFPNNILKLSAKTPEALDALLISYKCLLQNTEEDLNDICYTANIGRGDFQYRTAFLGVTELEILQNFEKKSYEIQQVATETPKLCFLFTGQGSQYPGMAKTLYDSSPIFKICFDTCASILGKDLGICIKSALWGIETEDINRTIYSQTSIFCVEYCLLKLWESWGIKPDFVLGHSLGEFAAAVAAGILSFKDALKLVATRSRLIENLPQGRMVVLKESEEKVTDLLKKSFKGTDYWLDVAAINSPEQTVLAGSEESVMHFVKVCQNNRVKNLILQSTHAFHSRLMDPMLEEYREIALNVKYNSPTCTFVSGMEGKVMEAGEVDADYWVRHTREPVRFTNASKTVLENGSTLFLEVGPQPILSSMIMLNSDMVSLSNPITCLPSLRKGQDDSVTMLGSLRKLYMNGMDIDWKNYHQFSGAKKIPLPFYPFQNKPHWFDMTKDRQKSIHPLVGTPMPNPSQRKLFENYIDINVTAYLKDHVIGNTTIFPGTGFLEMCLVSGHAAYQELDRDYIPPSAPMTLEDFVIDGPLALYDSDRTKIQVMVSSEDGTDTLVTIYSKLKLDENTYKWIRHASGKFSPFAVHTSGDDVVINDTLDKIKLRCSTIDPKFDAKASYKRLHIAGLKAGSTFQTIYGSWIGNGEKYYEMDVTNIKQSRYVCHPIVIDAMIQAIGLTSNPDADKLRVPVSISKFVWYANIKSKTCYIHISNGEGSSDDEYTAVLYDSNGQRIALMIGASLFETTVTSIVSAVEAQRTSLPSMYEEVWKNQLGPLEKRIPEFPDYGQLFSANFKDSLKQFNSVDKEKEIYYQKSNQLCLFYMLDALYKLGWTPQVGSTIVLNDLVTLLGIHTCFKGFLRYILTELATEGFLTHSFENGFEIVIDLPSMIDVTNGIDLLCNELGSKKYPEMSSLQPIAQQLAGILSGKQSPLPILFPEDETKFSPAETFYNLSEICTTNFATLEKILPQFMNSLQNPKETSKHVLRVLEVGAGTGSFTKQFLPHAENYTSDIEYTYTDISPGFVSKGEKIFENSKVKCICKTIDIEADPLTQGFIPEQYDVIFASFVLHETQSVRKAVANLRKLLRPGGCLFLTELTKPLRIVNLIFGVLDGFWKFTDQDIRPYNCEMGSDMWKKVLKEQNLDTTASFDSYFGHSSVIVATASKSSNDIVTPPSPVEQLTKTWLVFSNDNKSEDIFIQKLNAVGRNVVLVKQSQENTVKINPHLWHIRPSEESDMQILLTDISPTDTKNLEGIIYLWGVNVQEGRYDLICRPFLSLCKILVNFDQTKLLVVTRGVISLGDHELTQPFASPLMGMTKTLINENPSIRCKCVDLDPTLSLDEGLDEIYREMFIDDSETDISYRGHQRNICRIVSLKLPNNSLRFPNSERFRLILPSSRAISDLRFGVAEKPVLGNSQVEIQVKAYGLNFKDVLVVLKPDSQFDNYNTVGLDFAGVITRLGDDVKGHEIGDRVFGINLKGDSFPSHIQASQDLIIPICDNMTFCDAATLPAVAATAYLCLLRVAKLQKNETVLIHTGSGGVGLCAIQIAKSLNCNIITTAGSVRKRAYLKNLGIKHIFNSRNPDYGTQIRDALGGKGVDVVLNSITGTGLKEASLSVCNTGARFIEMSKLNTWTKEEVQSMRPDVFYEIVDLAASSNSTMKEYLGQVKGLMDNSFIKAIPYVRFNASDIREAFDYLQKARHIGKVICVMPELDNQKRAGSEISTHMFNDTSTYLVTGGLGGIGMEIAKWMTDSGAKNLVLVGRKSPGEKVAEEIGKLRSKGVNIVVMNCDIGNFDQCEKLIDDLKSPEYGLPPLRGIMHSAGVLSDASYDNQNWEKFETTFNPKVNGGWNLHKLTLDYSLEHFVMFSSAVALMGNAGQSSHSAANAFLDGLTHYRNSIGLPATTINWGQWNHVGVAANLDLIGIKPITPFQGISALEQIMKRQKLQTCVLEANFGVIRKVFLSRKRYLEEIKDGNAVDMELMQIRGEDFWREYDQVDENKKHEVVNKFIRSIIRQILKMEEKDLIDDNANLQDMGMDSLMMIEMKNVLQSLIGSKAKLTANAVKDCSTVELLGNRVVELISGGDEPAPLSKEELRQLIQEDSSLAVEVQPPSQEACKTEEIHTVLITGVSGNLGPYILRELCKRPQITKIYCLMRGDKTNSSKHKLHKILEEKNLLSSINMDLVECIPGNIIDPKFGLSKEKYDKLAQKVDGIFHLAVKSAWLELYRKSRHSDNDIRTVNVIGTKNMLEFSCASKTKHFYYASGSLTVTRMGEDGLLSEDWPHPSDIDNSPNEAYPFSKFICDRLMAQAVERGLPCKAFRFPFIGGDSKDGSNISIMNNALMLRMMSYMQLGVMPAYPMPLVLVPVDICADISIRIFFNKEAGYEIYNVCNPDVNDEQEFEDLAEEFGHPIEIVDPNEFIDIVEKEPYNELLVFIKKLAYTNEYRERAENDPPPSVQAWLTKQSNIFWSKKLDKFIPEYPDCMETTLTVLRRDLEFAKKSGVFAKVGLS